MTVPKNFSEIQAFLDGADYSGCAPCRVAVLRNVVLEAMEPYLRYHLYQAGLDGQLVFGEYDNVAQEALGISGGPLDEAVDCVVVAQTLELLSPGLAGAFPQLSAAEVVAERDAVLGHIATVLAGIRRATDAPLIWYGFETPPHPALGILDAQEVAGQMQALRTLNAGIRELLAQASSAYFLDMDLCLARVGMQRFYDRRWWYRGRAPYAREGLVAMADETARFIRAVRGRVRKCLVLDCDGVLWGGVVGEDGLAGLRLGPEHPGASYLDFQREVLNLARRGVVLALCSKNNEPDVWEVFDKHPHMLLTRDDIAAWRIDWNDKAANIRALAEELNLGLDSFVFVDDSPFEVELVRSQLPEVAVLHLPEAGAVGNRDILAGCGLFDGLTRSAEDGARGAMYRAEAGRRKLRTEISDMRAYYQSLEMRLDIRRAGDWSMARIAQLTQKTNQFNLTTRRYTEDDVRAMAASADHEVVCVALADRFGDMGIIGAAIVALGSDGQAVLETFLLSCRAIGRGVETAFLAEVLALLRARGVRRAVGLYLPTPKNAQVQEFYAAQGFAPQAPEAVWPAGPPATQARGFALDLDGPLPLVPEYFAALDVDLIPEEERP